MYVEMSLYLEAIILILNESILANNNNKLFNNN